MFSWQNPNNNESLNGVIWKRCPKDIYVGRTTSAIGALSALIDFNEGVHCVLKVMKEYGLDECDWCRKFCISRDLNRIKKWTLSAVKVHSSRESITGPYEKV